MRRSADFDGRPLRSCVRNGIELFDYERIVWHRAWARHRNASRSHCDVEDLAQEGWIALMRAADLYQPDRGVRFSTFAWRVVDRAVLRSVYNLKFAPNRISESRALREASLHILPRCDISRDDARKYASARSTEPPPHWKAQLHDAFAALTRTCSTRERAVLEQIALSGKSGAQVARDLGLTPQAISNHVVSARKRANLLAVSA